MNMRVSVLHVMLAFVESLYQDVLELQLWPSRF